MQFIEGKKAVKEIFGNQYFHTPILQTEQRFYLIKIDSIDDLFQSLKKPKIQKQTTTGPSNELNTQKSKPNPYQSISQQKKTEQQLLNTIEVTFEVGYRSSSQNFNLKDIKKKAQQKDSNSKYKGFQSQQQQKQQPQLLHIFPFEREQVMSITLKNKNQKIQQFGYALMPLVPFIKMSQTKHQVQICLVSYNDKKQIKDEVVAKLNISLYFLNDFKGNLIVQPIEAQLSRNLAQIGQMAPILRFFLRDYSFVTDKIDEGGMRPNWQSPNSFCYFNIPIKSIFDKLFLKLYYRRQVTIDEQIGDYKIDLQNQGFFRQGLSIDEFMKTQRDRFINNNKMLNSKGRQVFNSQAEKTRKQSAINMANLSKNEKKDILAKQKKVQFQQLQIREIQKYIDQVRQSLVEQVIKKQTTINSISPPLKIADLTQKIFNLYQDRQPQILTYLQKQTKVNIHEFVGEDLQEIKNKSQTSLKGEMLKDKIKKMLIKEIKILMDFASKKMTQVDVPLFALANQENAYQKITVGKLKLRYLFLYEFQVPAEEQ